MRFQALKGDVRDISGSHEAQCLTSKAPTASHCRRSGDSKSTGAIKPLVLMQGKTIDVWRWKADHPIVTTGANDYLVPLLQEPRRQVWLAYAYARPCGTSWLVKVRPVPGYQSD